MNFRNLTANAKDNQRQGQAIALLLLALYLRILRNGFKISTNNLIVCPLLPAFVHEILTKK